MILRIAAIIFIYVCTCIGWVILGETVRSRTIHGQTDLRQDVSSIWGRPQVQSAPTASYSTWVPQPERQMAAGAGGTAPKGSATETPSGHYETHAIPLTQSRVKADLLLEHRRKGLVWYSTYTVAFQGEYQFVNTSDAEREVALQFVLPEGQALYDGFRAWVNGQEVPGEIAGGTLTMRERVPAGGTLDLRAEYRSQGLDEWTYRFAKGISRVSDFQMVMSTNFDRIDFPGNSLAPTGREKTDKGWKLRWEYSSLLSGLDIAMLLPAKPQPGELVARITFFAPVSLMFFFFLMFILTLMKGIEIHPMNYFFLAAAFFSFHLLLAYTADLIDLHISFLLSAAVSIFLVVSYLRIVAGMRFALFEAGALQFLYLVGFSYAFFVEGYSALCVTVGSIVTLFLLMQLTARVRWAEVFRRHSSGLSSALSGALERARGGISPPADPSAR